MPRVLLTEGEQRSTLAVARSLGRAGFEILVSSSTGRSISGACRYVEQDLVTPKVMADPTGHARAISRIIRRHRVDALIPMTDASGSVLLGLRADHPDLLIPLPDVRTWLAASDKAALTDLARTLSIPVPRQVTLQSSDDSGWQDWAPDRYPIIVKPHRSVVFDGARLLHGPVGIGYDETSTRELLRDLPPDCYPVLLQERIVGPGRGAFFLVDRGVITASFAHKRIREKPPTGGVSVLREAVAIRDDIREYSERLLSELGWSGVAMVEFKEDAETGTPYLMEINARFWGSLQLAIDAGVDFPAYLMAQVGLLDGRRAGDSLETGVRTRWLLGDLDHLIWMLKAPAWKRAEYGLGSRLSAAREFLTSAGPHTRLEVLRGDDARPFVREATAWVRDLLGLGR